MAESQSKRVGVAMEVFVASATVALAVLVGQYFYFRGILEELQLDAKVALIGHENAMAELSRYAAMNPRSGNLPWLNSYIKEVEEWRNGNLLEETGDVLERLEHWESFVDENGFAEGWRTHLNDKTPKVFQHIPPPIDCEDGSQVVISPAELIPSNFNATVRDRAVRALTECGFVYLDNFFDPAVLSEFKTAFEGFVQTEEADRDFKYPCQGSGRIEHMMPFRPPFNESKLYGDPRLRDIVFHFLSGAFKLELMTVINSPVGSGDQRWHQGWRYLFHPEERLPPFALVVGVPLVDVSPDMGPTDFCPGKKLRFYQGWRCNDAPLSAGSSFGSAVLFDYKTLHRGPANRGARDRSMVSMVFSKMFFANSEAYVNRGISLVQTLHQRRYWEQFVYHPEVDDQYFQV